MPEFIGTLWADFSCPYYASALLPALFFSCPSLPRESDYAECSVFIHLYLPKWDLLAWAKSAKIARTWYWSYEHVYINHKISYITPWNGIMPLSRDSWKLIYTNNWVKIHASEFTTVGIWESTMAKQGVDNTRIYNRWDHSTVTTLDRR